MAEAALAPQNPEERPKLTILPDVIETSEKSEMTEISESLSLPQRVKYALSGAVVAAEVSPVNEAIRGAITLGVAGTSHNSAATAIALGGSTLLVEGAAALAATPLLKSNTANKVVSAVRSRVIEKYGEEAHQQESFSGMTYASAAFIGGSVVSMALKKYDQPNIQTEDLRKHGLKAAVGLSAVLGAAGLAGHEAVDAATDNPAVVIGVGLIAAGYAAGRRMLKKVRHLNYVIQPEAIENESKFESATQWADSDKYGVKYGVLNDRNERAKTEVTEQVVWHEQGFGDLEEDDYTKYFPASRVVGAFKDDECVGAVRMFRGTEFMPPFIENMQYDSEEERERLSKLYLSGDAEELGMTAVVKEYRGKWVNQRLNRIAYRDAKERGVQYWGIVMEPERVEKMNNNHGFTFRQLGEPIWYQGGNCAAFVMDLDDVKDNMRTKKPLQHFWFFKKKLRASDK